MKLEYCRLVVVLLD